MQADLAEIRQHVPVSGVEVRPGFASSRDLDKRQIVLGTNHATGTRDAQREAMFHEAGHLAMDRTVSNKHEQMWPLYLKLEALDTELTNRGEKGILAQFSPHAFSGVDLGGQRMYPAGPTNPNELAASAWSAKRLHPDALAANLSKLPPEAQALAQEWMSYIP